ncbi:MAG: hypothetical protein WC628_03640 [Candidatus Omnitrophota bacterium]
MNRKGIILIACYMVIAVLMILSTAFVARSVSGSRIAQRYANSTQAFWLAEAGAARAIKNLPAVDAVGSVTIALGDKSGTYSATIVQQLPTLNQFRIVSTGTVNNVSRVLNITVELPLNFTPNPGYVSYFLETSGKLKITGNVKIIPADSYITGSTRTFDSIFGVSKVNLRQQILDAVAKNYPYVHYYNNPPNNTQPVNGITWVDLSGDDPLTATAFDSSSGWTGTGLLIIDGHRNALTNDIPALNFTGHGSFQGMIWVMGTAKIAGTPIVGSVFAESDPSSTTKISGNVTMKFDSDAVIGAFGGTNYLSNAHNIVSWSEG